MPMHYKLTWAVDPEGQITTSTPVADFYWMVHTPDDTMYGFPNTHWWRFPAKTLTLDTLADTTNWITSEFYEDAHSGWYHLLDDSFTVLDSVPWDAIHYGPANPPRSLDDFPASSVSYGKGSPVRMSVYYRGTHAFYLNRIEVYDEGAWRMFASPDTSDWFDSISVAFERQWNNSNGKLAGWYYDEWDLSGRERGDPSFRSLIQVNKILTSNPPLPTMFVNGYGADYYDTSQVLNGFLNQLAGEGISIPVHMNEMYMFGADSCWVEDTCEFPCAPRRGLWAVTTEFYPTDCSSDAEYVRAEQCEEIYSDGTNSQHTYHGAKSLQAAIDAFMFDVRPLYSLGDIDPSPYLPNASNVPTWFSIAPQTKFHRERQSQHPNMKYWALIAGGGEGENDPDYFTPLRDPTPNEVKLNGWLAVAADADGIMWYPWNFGGLFYWDDALDEFRPNERYYGAKEFGQDIQRIAPILESLVFVKTYASRAFETDYPDSTYEATQRDILFTNGSVTRSVQDIATYLPDGDGGWEEAEEGNSYVQISRFRNDVIPENDPDIEDYWFLVVNRRALEDEQRKVTLTIDVGTPATGEPYFVDYVLGDSTRLAAPCQTPETTCEKRFVDFYLEPGDAELIHFTRSFEICAPIWAHMDSSVTAQPLDANHLELRWEEVTETDSGDAFDVDEYFILGSPRDAGPFTPIGVTSDTSYIDSVFTIWPEYFYMVQACGGTIQE